MATTTITEALAELKTLAARIEKKREHSGHYILRDSRAVDPMLKEGGSATFIQREWQAIADMEARFIRIRRAIQLSNLTSTLELRGKILSIAEWLIWRRELAEGRKRFLANVSGSIQRARREASTVLASAMKNAPAGFEKGDLLVNVDEAALLTEIEQLDETLSELDGRLSLLNATTTIPVD